MSDLPIDLDAEAIFLDGGWHTREDLTRRIKSMLDSGDFNVAKPSAALEQLTHTLTGVRTLTVRVTPELAEGLNQLAARLGQSVGAAIREAVTQYLTDQGVAGATTQPPAAAQKAATPLVPRGATPPPMKAITITPSPSSPPAARPVPAPAPAPAPVHTFTPAPSPPASASSPGASFSSLPVIDVDEEPMVQQEPTVRYAMTPPGTTQDDLPKVIVDEQPMVIAGPGALANAGVPAARPIELTQKKP